MKAIVVETDNDQIIDLVIDALLSRLRSYKRQNHSASQEFAAALGNISIVDDQGNISIPESVRRTVLQESGDEA
jgi:hypothetical protein